MAVERSVESIRAHAKPRNRTAARLSQGVTLSALWGVIVPSVFLMFLLASQVGFVDLGYHLRAGDWTWTHGRPLDHDIFTHTVGGTDWLNQNWLAQLVLYGVGRIAGIEGLAAVNAFLFAAGFVILLKVTVRRSGEVRSAALACLVTVLPSLFNTAVRPQSFSWLFMAIVILLLEDTEANPRRLLWLVPLTALWANIHGAFAVGLAFVVIEAITSTLVREGRRRPRWMWTIAGLSFFAALLNPWGWRVYTYVVGIGSNPTIRSFIDEWQPPTVTTIAGVLFFLSVSLVVAELAISSVKLGPRDLLRLGFGAGLGLLAIRNGLWWTMAAAPPLATLLSPIGAKFAAASARERPKRAHLGILAFVALLLVLTSPWLRSVSPLIPSSERQLPVKSTPISAARFLRDNDLAGNMFNSQSFGSFLELAATDHLTFIDSRIELFPEELWNEYKDVMSAAPGWNEILLKRNIGYIVVTKHPRPVLVEVLEKSGEWTQAYSDRVALIYTRVNPNDG